MKTIAQILFICFVFVAKIYAQSTDITLYVLESKDKNWQGIKLQDKRHSKLSLASKLLKANKDGEIQAYHYDSKENTKVVAIKYSQVAKNMQLPIDEEEPDIESLQKPAKGKDTIPNLGFFVDSTPNYFIIDIRGINIISIKGEKYFALIFPANKRPENKDFTIALYKVSDIEKLFKFKICFEYALCKVCNFEADENTDKEFVANPSMPEYEYREKKE
jgi:hypothetical protein